MIRSLMIAVLALLVAACGGSNDRPSGPPNPAVAAQWEIGPVVEGHDASVGVPVHPYAIPGEGWGFDLPPWPGSAHYVTARLGPLIGKTRIVMHYRVVADEGVVIKPKTGPEQPSILTLYFQRRGDDWSGLGKFETYRWYATGYSQSPIHAGEFELNVPLAGPGWTAIMTSHYADAPLEFTAAKTNADRVGFVLGGGTGYGHGVFATGRARIIVTSFRLE